MSKYIKNRIIELVNENPGIESVEIGDILIKEEGDGVPDLHIILKSMMDEKAIKCVMVTPQFSTMNSYLLFPKDTSLTIV